MVYIKDEAGNIPEPGSDEWEEKTDERNQEIAIFASRGERCIHDCAIRPVGPYSQISVCRP
jgi:hypothetical protein